MVSQHRRRRNHRVTRQRGPKGPLGSCPSPPPQPALRVACSPLSHTPGLCQTAPPCCHSQLPHLPDALPLGPMRLASPSPALPTDLLQNTISCSSFLQPSPDLTATPSQATAVGGHRLREDTRLIFVGQNFLCVSSLKDPPALFLSWGLCSQERVGQRESPRYNTHACAHT